MRGRIRLFFVVILSFLFIFGMSCELPGETGSPSDQTPSESGETQGGDEETPPAEEEPVQTGIVTGQIYESEGRGDLPWVTVTAVGSDVSVISDTDGSFDITLPIGNQRLQFSLSGYEFYDVDVLVEADQTTVLGPDVIGYPPLLSGAIRIVLDWDVYPLDIDAHLYVVSSEEEVYWYLPYTLSGNVANLDWDDTESYGPETITIYDMDTGTYYYSVGNWSEYYTPVSNDYIFSDSKAMVNIYDSGGTLLKTYDVDDAVGDDGLIWWRVFSLENGVITDIMTFNDSAGATWSGGTGGSLPNEP